MNGLELLYRGSLKSCNYQCSYCPFSKHRMSERELSRDREQWECFVETIQESADSLKIRSVMVTPYGEALIHRWYWEGLGRISALAGIEAVGAQTNLSFPVAEALEYFRRFGGKTEKLHLWATFHPEMTSVEEFSGTCKRLSKEGVRLCAGAVGVPKHTGLLQKLRAELPQELYLWVNRMDGLKRPYSREEVEAFLELDPCFLRELSDVPADPGQCRNRLFVEGNGKLKICNISRNLKMNWEEFRESRQKAVNCGTAADFSKPQCGQKRCSCYLAYGGREDFMNQILFGPHPVFRIPRHPKAVFLDLVGTLLIKGGSGQEEEISAWVRAGLEALHQKGIPLFFATTLPYQEARKRCREIWHLFSGGIFAGGAHVVLEENIQREAKGRWEMVQGMEESCLPVLERARTELRCRMRIYRFKKRLYKVTLLRPEALYWQEEERQKLSELLQDAGFDGLRVFAEENCLQILSGQATKAEGVRRICRKLHIDPEEAAAAGDSSEDAEMLRICHSAYQKLRYTERIKQGNNRQIACRYPEN